MYVCKRACMFNSAISFGSITMIKLTYGVLVHYYTKSLLASVDFML